MNKFLNIAFLSTYPPRECGIATFTQDLVRELKKQKHLKTGVIALSDSQYAYDEDVYFELPQQGAQGYIKAAERINASDIQVLIIEHEYGIFGGDSGEQLLELVKRVKKPIITTLHTVLPSPKEKQRNILKELCQRSEKVVIMASNSRKLLKDVYGADPSKIEMIPHGVPSFDIPPQYELKKEMDMEGRIIVSTFGLLSPGKGLAQGIEAVAQVAKKHTDILYMILGQTHPVIKKKYGETYRTSLKKKVQELGLENNVRFVNKYLEKEEIIRSLVLSDIYMTPYLGREQAVSGTLAYAIGYGRAVVSTPYPYARELLADGRGLLAEFEDVESLDKNISFLIEHPEKRQEMEEKAMRLGVTMRWDAVAGRYIETCFHVFNAWLKKKNENNRI